jgi:hypothetical protein
MAKGRTVDAPEALAEIRVKGPVYVQALVFAEDVHWIEAKKEDLNWHIKQAQKEGHDPKFHIWREDGDLYLSPA